MVSSDLQHFELGLQKLAPLAVHTLITAFQAGASGSVSPRRLRAIILPRLPGQGNVLAFAVPSGTRVRVPREGSEVMLQVAACIEQCPSCDIFALATPTA